MFTIDAYTPARVIFGAGRLKELGSVSLPGKKALICVTQDGLMEKLGIQKRVTDLLKENGTEYVIFDRVQPNPTQSGVMAAAALARKENCDFVIGLGGGSSVDTAKATAIMMKNPGVLWDYAQTGTGKNQPVSCAAPIVTISTTCGTGTETDPYCVITNEENGFKRGFNSATHRPLFSICNPELTYSVSRYQTGCGTVDIMMHTLERYFTQTRDTMLTDRIAEGILKSTIEAGRIADREPDNYEARATLMWAGSLSHNGLTSAGRSFLMQVHQMEHELSGMYPQIAHGAGLSALWPSWARYVCSHDVSRFARYGVNVWNIDMDFGNPMNTALAGIQATEDFYKSLGMPVTLKELGVERDRIEEMAEKCTNMGQRKLSGIVELGREEIIEIYGMAMGE